MTASFKKDEQMITSPSQATRIGAMTTPSKNWQQRLHQLDQQLSATAELWRPQPFKQQRPAWCQSYPQLTQALLDLDDQQLQRFSHNPDALVEWIGHYLPQVAQLDALSRLPKRTPTEYSSPENRFFNGMPGRKRTQIEAFASHVGSVTSPILEWCGGKGHLGRLLGMAGDQPVTTLELNPELCRAGEQQAQRFGLYQSFTEVDLLQPGLELNVTDHHGVALHACGELHRSLQRRAVTHGMAALDIVPCCYAFGVEQQYQPRTQGLSLQLSRDDLRLAVTETVTAGQAEVTSRDREMAWKLGFVELRNRIVENQAYRTMKPVQKQWLKLSFSQFCQQLADREALSLPADTDWAEVEAFGWQRFSEVMRLSLLRNCFRRPIELWLILDLVTDLEAHDYQIELGTFCDRAVTPRNIMLSARKRVESRASSSEIHRAVNSGI
ncbi:MAG: methyltransferase [Amphritea sp.]|nr:methyltransferase [Amphritea sp.]